MITVVALSTVLEVLEEETHPCAMKEAPDGNVGTRKAKGEHNDIQIQPQLVGSFSLKLTLSQFLNSQNLLT